MKNTITISINTKDVDAALRGGKFTAEDMKDMEKPIALTVINKQRELVPVKTADTKNSISQHIQEATAARVIDHVGPETTYAPSIEYGITSKPNYPIQPFVRPSVFGNEATIKSVAAAAYRAKIAEKYHG